MTIFIMSAHNRFVRVYFTLLGLTLPLFQSAEYEHDYAPMWRYVMKYMHFTDRIEAITSFYLREILELPSEGEIPPVSFPNDHLGITSRLTRSQYIAIHVRHGDFSTWCWAAEDPADCFAPISVIARRVRFVISLSASPLRAILTRPSPP